MDWWSHRLSNRLLGNAPEAATLEVTLGGLDLEFGTDVWFAVTGAECPWTLDGRPVGMFGATRARAGSILRSGMRSRGARGYVAFAGGIDVPRVLGSRATHTLSHLGGLEGRALRAGDRLTLGRLDRDVRPHRAPSAVPLPVGGARLRVLKGPHVGHLSAGALDTLHGSRYTLSPRSDRMGYRLDGAALAWPPDGIDLVSGAAVVGALQVPRSGAPILLMADRATTGGYPIAAVVISADLPQAGQLAPGDWIEFVSCTRPEAVAALRQCEEALARVDA
jgi:antagonist of KipI